jgi:hypothetical protein
MVYCLFIRLLVYCPQIDVLNYGQPEINKNKKKVKRTADSKMLSRDI